MANKRMFSMKIVDSDAFLDMPLSTQCLYFHLNMRADDDGFVDNTKRIMRLIGSSEDDLKLLIAKRFVLTFDTGVIVIKHWRMHNTLSKNRYHETQYLEEKGILKIKNNGSYSLNNGEPIDDTKMIEMSSRQSEKSKDEQTENAVLDKDLDIEQDTGIDKIKNKNTKKKEPTVYYPNDEKLNQAFLDFMEMRKKIKKPMTDRAVTLAMNKLQSIATLPFSDTMDNDLAIQILEQSTMNCWQGLFPLKEDKQQKSNGDRNIIDEWRNA